MPASNSEARKRAEQLGKTPAGWRELAEAEVRDAAGSRSVERALQWAQDRSVLDPWSLHAITYNPREVVAHLAVLLGEVRRLRDIETAHNASLARAGSWTMEPANPLTFEDSDASEQPERLDAVSVQPGDIIVARVSLDTSIVGRDAITRQLKRVFPDNEVAITTADISVLHPEVEEKRTCALCGASPPVGSASVTPQRGEVALGSQTGPEWPLCHPDNGLPDCYVLWTVYGRRPNK